MKCHLSSDEIITCQAAADEIVWWWLGQSGFVYKTKDVTFVIDPYLSTHLERITKDSPVNRHNRMMPIPIQPEDLKGIDYICCTHDHLDHYDPETVLPMLEANPGAKVVIPRAAWSSLMRDGVEEARIVIVDTQTDYEDTRRNIHISAVRGKHNEFDYTEERDYPYLGLVIEAGPCRLYHAGDTIWFPELLQLVSDRGIDVAFLPVNGGDEDRQNRGFMSNLQFDEAADLGKAMGAKLVVPCHYDMFDINTEQIGRFVNYANAMGLSYTVPLLAGKFIYKGEER